MAQIEQAKTETLPGVRPSFRGKLTYGGLLSAAGEATQAEGQAAQNLGNLGKTIENFTLQVAKDTKDDQDKSYVRDLYKKYTDDVRGLKEQYQSQKGENAMGLTKKAQDEIDKLTTNYNKLLKNDNQRRLFEPLALSRRISTADVIGNYERAETLRWKHDSAKSMADAVLQDGIANYTDPTSAKATAQQMKIATDDLLPGASQKEKDLVYRDYMSRYYLGVTEKYALSDAEAAQAYYKSVKKNMLGTYQLKAEDSLKTAALAAKVEKTTQEIVQKSHDDITMGSKLVEQIKDPIVRSEVRKAYTFRRRLNAEIKKQAEQQAFDEINQEISNFQNPDLAIKMIRTSGLPATKQNTLISVVRARALNGGKVKTDYDAYYDLKLLSPEKFVKIDLRDYRDKLSDPVYKQLIDEQTREKESNHITKSRSFYKMGDQALQAIGFPADKKDVDTSQKRFLFFKEFDKRLDEIPKDERTINQVQGILDEMMKEVVLHKHWWGDTKKYEFALTPKERAKYTNIPFDPDNPPANIHWDEKNQRWVKEEGGKLYTWGAK